jgi:hypothetical protein
MNTKQRINITDLDATIADLARQALAAAQRDGWASAAYLALSREIAARRATRARILARRRA